MAGFGHVAVGLAAARLWTGPDATRRTFAWAAAGFCALSLGPDLDVVGFPLGVPYGADWGHRGASHSMVMALIVATAVALLWHRSEPRRMWLLAFLTVSSHGLLDILTDGGHGVALWWPVDLTRHFAPWRPLPVSPIGAGLLSMRGAYVFGFEVATFGPLWLWALLPLTRKRPQART